MSISVTVLSPVRSDFADKPSGSHNTVESTVTIIAFNSCWPFRGAVIIIVLVRSWYTVYLHVYTTVLASYLHLDSSVCLVSVCLSVCRMILKSTARNLDQAMSEWVSCVKCVCIRKWRVNKHLGGCATRRLNELNPLAHCVCLTDLTCGKLCILKN